jgi:exopolysaccharide biosynthesis protein
LATGFGWLVRRGVSQVTSNSSTLIAPRTAIGTDSSGRVMIFQADGVEDLKRGLTLYQLAEWLVTLKAYNFINLDGGGSSVTYYNNTVVSVPTCLDKPFECQRMVTTMTCVMP